MIILIRTIIQLIIITISIIIIIIMTIIMIASFSLRADNHSFLQGVQTCTY